MGSLALGEPVPSLETGVSTSLESPIARSGVEAASGSKRSDVEDPSQTASNLDRLAPPLSTSSPGTNTNHGSGVSELLQRALTLKEGNDSDEIKDGERTPGTHSPASTDLTAVDQNRISPVDSLASRPEEFSTSARSSRPAASRNNSLASANADPPRLRHSNSRRPSNRPYPPTHYHSNQQPQQQHNQQRVSPPQGWHGVSPTSSNEGANHNQGNQMFYPPQAYNQGYSQQSNGGNGMQNSAGGGGGGGGGTGGGNGGPYGFTTTTPPFLAHLPRHPSHISQISDHSAGYSTGSPYSSSSSSLWYQHYASTVTTPSSYPAALEGGLVYPNDVSPEPHPDALSSQQCLPSTHSQYEPATQGYAQNSDFVESPGATSPVGPYQAVYFAPPPKRVTYGPPEGYSSAPSAGATTAPALGHPSQSSSMVYPITSSRSNTMNFEEHVTTSQNGYGSNWRAARHQSTLVPTQQQQYAVQYNHPYATPVHYTNNLDQRYYSQAPHPSNAAPRQHYASHPYPSANSRPHPPPPAIPPRPPVIPQFSPRSMPMAMPFPPPSPPKIYAPPVEIARGVLASTRLREAANPSGGTKPVRATRTEGLGRTGAGPRKGNLPKPPAHSPHALWVGNVPSDASHSELWQFFVSRPSPSAVGMLSNEDIDLSTPGVESIHLIARSNCAFVNYVSNLHLKHAISVSNGLSLRPNDPRCKTLLCRVRKEEDESKTGVGAQRVGGIHKAFVKLQQERMGESEENLRLKIREEGASPKSSATRAFEERRQSSSNASVGTTSTTSSFLTKHFEKRWFILKSHDEADLQLSVESGLWATQPHNEPVLQQAYKTAKEVFLVFSANGSGEWFGYARMSGPIASVSSSKSSRPSWGSSGQASIEGSASSASLSVPSQTIQEDSGEPSSFPPRAPVLFSPSEHRLAQTSPSLMTPSTAPQSHSSSSDQRQGGSYPLKLPSEIDAEAKREMALEQERMAFVTSSNLHLPVEVAEAARKAATYDSGALKKARALVDPVPPGSLRDAIRQVDMATGERMIVKTGDRDDARKPARSGSSSTWGTPFSIEWVKITRLPFARTRHIRNSFNGNREIKVSRDGTEVEPAAGQALIDEFDRLVESPEAKTTPTEASLPRRP